MTIQIVATLGAAVVSAVVGYLLGTRLRGRPTMYRSAFVGVVLGVIAVLAVAFFRSDTTIALITLGCGFGLLNGVRHGYTRPFEGLTPGSIDTSDD